MVCLLLVIGTPLFYNEVGGSMSQFNQLSINQFTTLQQWSLQEAVEGYARHGIHGIAVVRDKLKEIGAREAARILHDHDMTVTGYCIGGLLTDLDDTKFQASLDDNKRVLIIKVLKST